MSRKVKILNVLKNKGKDDWWG